MDLAARLRAGLVIPAHPLALTAERRLDERHQRALTRYYLAAGAGGIAVGVHTTQFEIRDPKVGLYRPVLQLAAETAGDPAVVRIAGVCGPTPQAVAEARVAADLHYHAALLSLGALSAASLEELIAHARAVAEILPLFGFYLQPAVGGRVLDYAFWRRFLEIDNVVAIKIAPFDRYQTLDVLRAVADSGRAGEVALYTGNDDHIVLDLLTSYRGVRIVGGLLGQWAVGTRRAVEMLGQIRLLNEHHLPAPRGLLTLANEVTGLNAALFDPEHNFAGCISGIHEVLRRQGLMAGCGCLDLQADLSAGQMEQIDRTYTAYPHLHDDEFVAQRLAEWLS
jgi:dihydrodipicolinate synthase/N-acetylneuraminate lyase